MDSLDTLSPAQWIIAFVGTIGLFLAAWFVFARMGKRSPSAEEPPPSNQLETPPPPDRREPISERPEQLRTRVQPPPPSPSLWRSALSKTRRLFGVPEAADLKSLREGFEEACLAADLGVHHTQEALESVDWARIEALPSSARSSEVRKELRRLLSSWLTSASNSAPALSWPSRRDSEPCVLWFVGVNGAGKTTSIAKLAAELKNRGHSVLLGAGDTFRAAAGEQLETWADRLEIPIVKGQAGADASAVLFDAIQSAKSRRIDYVLCDSAGRLHNQGQLMDSLKKNKRVMDKALPGAPHETLLVLDGNTGQNMVAQAETFLRDIGVTGLVLTKLDGTARGGAVFSVARKTGLPIRRLGLGETAADFRPFEPDAFADAVLGEEVSETVRIPDLTLT